jgi:micrococcal nuclease
VSLRGWVAALALIGGCDGGEPPGSPCGPTRARVERAVDGDTIDLVSGERVRYLLVDTNELSSQDCFALEAQRFNAQLVEGREVTLLYDAQCTDRFGRLLAYVSVAGREVNRLLLERGYACVLYIPPNGGDRRHAYEALEEQARASRAGMWGACEEVACDR